VRAEARADGRALLVVDAGDWFQGTPEGRLERGLGFLRGLAAIGHDALCVGNHEFDHGVDVLEQHLAAQPLPALLANAREPSGAPLAGTQEYALVERGGLRIALVGLLSVQTPEMSHPSTRALEWLEPAERLRDLRAELAGDVDWFLPLTHIGIGGDKELARAHPDLPLIVGGHSHTLLAKGVREGRTLIVQAGSKGRGVGRVDLWFDAATKRVLRSAPREERCGHGRGRRALHRTARARAQRVPLGARRQPDRRRHARARQGGRRDPQPRRHPRRRGGRRGHAP
jgi:2',3'-cyclic-nucleotide 2'-phosphodiesterase (5'-nucleotidase family)